MIDGSRDISKEAYPNMHFFLGKLRGEIEKIDQSEEKFEIVLLINKVTFNEFINILNIISISTIDRQNYTKT